MDSDAIRVEVGYSDGDEVYADLQPVSMLEGGLSELQLRELEGLIYAEIPKMDQMIAAFAHSVYEYLYNCSNVFYQRS